MMKAKAMAQPPKVGIVYDEEMLLHKDHSG